MAQNENLKILTSIKLILVCCLTSSHDDEDVSHFNKELYQSLSLDFTSYNFFIGDFVWTPWWSISWNNKTYIFSTNSQQIDYVLTNQLNIVQDIGVLKWISVGGDYLMIRWTIKMYCKLERFGKMSKKTILGIYFWGIKQNLPKIISNSISREKNQI